MWRRHSIAAKKASWDAKKSQNYAKVWKIIQIAARKWADPKMNPSLELALSKAKQYDLPREVVDKAILKWSGQLEWENLEEIFYEWYGPGWAAIFIKALTPNTNRTASSIKQITWKHWWSMWAMWSVSRQFKEKWIIVTDGTAEIINDKWKTVEKITPLDLDNFENYIIELPISDFETEETNAIIYTEKTDFTETQKKLESDWYHILESDLQFIPDNLVKLSEEEKNQFLTLIDALDNDEDVDTVWHNADL